MADIALAVLAAFVIIAVLAALSAYWAARRVRARLGTWQARALALRGRTLPPGPRRDAAALRSRLAGELQATRDMLDSAPDGVVFRADAGAILYEIATTASDLDRELAAVERFLDVRHQRAALDMLTEQVERVIETSYAARQTVLRTAVEDRRRRIAELEQSVAQQAAALDTYRRGRPELNI